MNPDKNQSNRGGGVLLRLRALFGRRRPRDPSIAAVMAQWVEYELIFNDILLRLNAQLARQAKVEKKQLARQLAATGDEEERGAHLAGLIPVAAMSKHELRSHFGRARFASLRSKGDERELAEAGSSSPVRALPTGHGERESDSARNAGG